MEDRYELYLEARSWEKAADAAARLKDPRCVYIARVVDYDLRYSRRPALRIGIIVGAEGAALCYINSPDG